MSVREADETPRYFLCPISLQIMKDPVTTPAGITYDRVSIEQWLFVHRRQTCPVTNTALAPDSDLTPNHTLRRLIQFWSALHSDHRIPTPRPPADLLTIQSLLHPLSIPSLAALAAESESNRHQIIRAGAPRRIISSLPKSSPSSSYPAVSLLLSLRLPPEDLKPLVADNYDLLDCLAGLISTPDLHPNAIPFLKSTFDLLNPKLIQTLKPDFFKSVVGIIRSSTSNQFTKAALQVLIRSCPLGTNRTKIVAAGAAAEIIEMEMNGEGDKRMTELGLTVMEQICKCADGRAAVVEHPAGMAVLAKTMIRVSATADEKAVGILTAVSRCLGTEEIGKEMAAVGVAAKLCLVLQAECLEGVREKARFVLRLYSRVWKDSPCVNLNKCFLSKYP